MTERLPLGKTGLNVSQLALGTSALGSMYRPVDASEGVAMIIDAFNAGMNLFDSAPAYGNTVAEQVLGQALKSLPRDEVVICTKAGKHTDDSGRDTFAYSERALRESVDGSCRRLGVDHLDILLLHDFDSATADTELALTEGLDTLRALKAEGRIRAFGAGIYDMAMWKRVLVEFELDVALVHNRHTLLDIRIFELLPLLEELQVGLISAAPFASGLLGAQPLPEWHPAPQQTRTAAREAAALATARGTSLEELALRFATSEPRVPVTMFSCSSRDELKRNLAWCGPLVDRRLVAEVQRIFEPVMNVGWPAETGADA